MTTSVQTMDEAEELAVQIRALGVEEKIGRVPVPGTRDGVFAVELIGKTDLLTRGPIVHSMEEFVEWLNARRRHRER